MTLNAEGAENHTGRFVHGFEHRSLLDMELEVGLRIDRLQESLGLMHPRQLDTVVAKRVEPALRFLFETFETTAGGELVAHMTFLQYA